MGALNSANYSKFSRNDRKDRQGEGVMAMMPSGLGPPYAFIPFIPVNVSSSLHH